jgi:tRNA (mo5U34)-methyltransferase
LLDKLRQEREKTLEFKNISSKRDLLLSLEEFDNTQTVFGDTIEVLADITDEQREVVLQTALALRPWRKGPFKLFDIFIDSEWKSFLKYNLLKKHISLKDKIVADIGCNNGYYLFRMLEDSPKKTDRVRSLITCKDTV